MATGHNPYRTVLRELAALMLGVSGESVSMIKRSDPERSLSLKPREEWGIYLEFLKILFNLADRHSVVYVPLKEQPRFMDGLEDAISDQLKSAMAPMLGPDSDPMEIVITIGKVVAESRGLYERFRFDVSEESKEKEACFQVLAERVAEAMRTTGKGMVTSSSVLCVSAVIPAMQSLFVELTQANAPAQAMGAADPGETSSAPMSVGNEIKLVSVMSSIQGEEVETRWGLHPQFRRDLSADETRELTRHMNRVAQILGERYASVAFSEAWASWHFPGHA